MIVALEMYFLLLDCVPSMQLFCKKLGLGTCLIHIGDHILKRV